MKSRLRGALLGMGLVGVSLAVGCSSAVTDGAATSSSHGAGGSSASSSDAGGAGGPGGGSPSTSSATSTSSASGGQGGHTDVPPQITFSCPGGPIEPGLNTITVDGKERQFYADFPANTATAPGLLLSWHGYGDNFDNFRKAVDYDPDASADHPLIVLTPEDTKLQPPTGLGWDIAKGKPGDTNVDLPFFEAMVGCAAEHHHIDPARVYSLGFSAGSVFTSLLASRYPRLFAAVIAESGAWMNDPNETALVKVISVDWSWPALDSADRGEVLLTHGGANDVTVFNVFDLEAAAQAAFPFLKAANRTVVDCAHDQGHTLHPDVTIAVMSKYLSAHELGEPSPFPSGFEGYPSSCTLRLP